MGDYYSGTVELVNTISGQSIYLLENIHSNGDLIFSPNGKIIAGECFYRDAVILFDVNSKKQLKILEEKENFHTSEITAIAFSSDSKLLASASYDLTIRVWNIAKGKQIKIIEGHNSTIFNLSFTNKDRVLISASADCNVCFWKI